MSDSDDKSKLRLKMSVAQLETMSTKRINIKYETYLHSILVGNICAKSVPRKVSPRYSVVEKSTFTIHDIDS